MNIVTSELASAIYLAMQSANTTGSGELVAYEPVRCGHEAYQGFCAHCGVPIINGVAKVPRPILAIATPDTDREPLVWEATTPAYTRFITDSKYQKLRPAYRKWYRPVCQKCAADTDRVAVLPLLNAILEVAPHLPSVHKWAGQDRAEDMFDVGLRHKSGKKPYDYLKAWLGMLRPFAYATQDDSWGEMEKLLCIVMRNYVRVAAKAGEARAALSQPLGSQGGEK